MSGTDPAAALNAGFMLDESSNPTPLCTVAHDGAGRTWTYTYVNGLTPNRALTKIEIKSGDTVVWMVECSYYTEDEADKGLIGDLKTITETKPLTSGGDEIRKNYFRYFTSATLKHLIKMHLGPEGTRRAEASGLPLTSATDSQLTPFAKLIYTYAPTGQVTSMYTENGCGCSSSRGAYLFSGAVQNLNYNAELEYLSNGTQGTGDWTYERWKYRTEAINPDGTYQAIYSDEFGRRLARVVSDGAGGAGNAFDPASNKLWIWKYERDGLGRVVTVFNPDSIDASAYVHDFGGSQPGKIVTRPADGLVKHITYSTSPYLQTAVTSISVSKGTGGTPVNLEAWSYLDPASAGNGKVFGSVNTALLAKPVPASHTIYRSSSAADTTTYSYQFYSAAQSWAIKSRTATLSGLAPGDISGPVSVAMISYFDEKGRLVFFKDGAGRYTYTKYNGVGLVAKVVEDVSTSDSDAATAASAFSVTLPAGSAGLCYVTTYTYDNQGRLISTTIPSGRVMPNHYTKLTDGRLVELGIPMQNGTNYSGPVSYRVSNLSGKAEAIGTIALNGGSVSGSPSGWIASSNDVISAVSSTYGILTHLSVKEYDALGTQMIESRQFFSMPSSYASAVLGTHYDSMSFVYDDLGRIIRTTDPTGTIHATSRDTLGRMTSHSTGTSLTNLLTTDSIEYDYGGVGNSWITSRTEHVTNNSSDDRVTTYTRDFRGRVQIQQNSTAPHYMFDRDDAGHVLATGGYSSVPGSWSSPVTTPTARVSLSETVYNSRGQVRASVRHAIAQSSGASSSSIESSVTYDGAGRPIKLSGETLAKTTYDGLGRPVQEFVLAVTDDASSSDAGNVTGDTVLEEDQTLYDDSARTGNVLMTVRVDRHPNDSSTTGALDAVSDGLGVVAPGNTSMHGRAQITSYFYDSLDRQIAVVELGNNNGSTYTRSGESVAGTRSDTRLITSASYNSDGTVAYTTDPRGISTVYDYDDAGRRIQTIANYSDGTPGPNDQDQAVAYAYTNGLMTGMTAKMTSSGDNQITTYTYGVTTSGPLPSAVVSNRLLQKVTYPDSTGGTDVVRYAYDRLGEQTGMIDQAGNQINTYYDPAGRIASKAVANLASGFDGAVRRIDMSYLSRGLVNQVTQYDAASGGSVTDQVQYGYDDWGNLSGFYQDVDSAMSSAGVSSANRGAWGTTYAYAQSSPTGGVNTVRRTNQYLQAQGSTFHTVGYTYGSGGINDYTSRVASVTTGSSPTTVASYDYLGANSLVGTTLDQAQLNTSVFDASSSITYPDVDQFNRPTRWNWERIGGASGGFYDTAINYDSNSNPASTLDNVHIHSTTSKHYFDVVYGIDGLNRVTKADEGHATGSPRAIQSGTHSRNELWDALSLTGNWGNRKLDANGDGDFTDEEDRNELAANNTFNKANEWTARQVGKTGTDHDSYTYTYDAVGNLTGESKAIYRGPSPSLTSRGFVYDAFGRLVAVTGIPTEDGPTYIAKYRYNGLGFRILSQEDDDANGSLDDAEKRYMMYDERWRVVSTFRTDDTSPKETYVYHAAGWNGSGDASYIDSVILRDRDNSPCNGTGCDPRLAESDGTLEERRFYCQNWRADVVAIAAADGTPIETLRYSAYGEPTVYPMADVNMDGKVDSTDLNAWIDLQAGGDSDMAYPGGDLDFDGSAPVDGSSDDDEFYASYNANLGKSGKGRLSSPSVDNRIGYAGYQWDQAIRGDHVRYRVYLPEIGRWTRRDPLGYVNGHGLCAYVQGMVSRHRDPMGLWLEGLGQALANHGFSGLGQAVGAVGGFAEGAVTGAGAEVVGAIKLGYELGATVVDQVGFAADAASTYAGYDLGYQASSKLGKAEEHGGSWSEVLSDTGIVGLYGISSVVSLGTADIVDAAFDYAETGDSNAFSEAMGAVAAGNLLAAKGLGTDATPEARPTGEFYSVAFEMELDPSDIGTSRPVHFHRANAALHAALESDPTFAAQMERMIPGVSERVSSVGGRDTPVDWTWHHADGTGKMQLVPSEQHMPGSIFQDALHPNGCGGYSNWAIPAGARPN